MLNIPSVSLQRLFPLIVLPFLLLAIGSCGGERASKKLILAENPVPLSSITIIAQDKGFFKEEGLDVEVRNFTTGKLCLDAVIGGGADFGTVAETPLMRAGFIDQKVYVIATIASSNNDCKVIARKDKGISVPQDLKSKKVATFVGTSAEFFMNAFLKAQGLSVTDVNVTNLQPPDMVAALVRGDIDAFFIWEPHIYNARKQLGDKAVVFTGQDVYTETFNIVVTERFAKETPDLVMKILKALIKTENFIKANRDNAISIVSQRVGMDSRVLSDIWSDFNFQVALDQTLLDFMNKQAQWAIEMGTAPSTNVPNYRLMILTEGLRELKPDSVTIR